VQYEIHSRSRKSLPKDGHVVLFVDQNGEESSSDSAVHEASEQFIDSDSDVDDQLYDSLVEVRRRLEVEHSSARSRMHMEESLTQINERVHNLEQTMREEKSFKAGDVFNSKVLVAMSTEVLCKRIVNLEDRLSSTEQALASMESKLRAQRQQKQRTLLPKPNSLMRYFLCSCVKSR